VTSALAGWDSVPCKRLYQVVDQRAGNDRPPLLAVSIHLGVVPREVITDNEPRADDLSGYKVCAPGDIVLNRMRAFQGAIGISSLRGLVSPDYLVIRPYPRAEPRFLHHLFRSHWFVGEMVSRLRGIGSVDQGNVRTPRINPDDLGDIVIRLPSLPEQRIIADFLDVESTRIDTLIANKRRMAELLVERSQSVIDEVVEGQGVRLALRRIATRITSGPRGWADFVTESGSLFLRITNVQKDDIELDLGNSLFVNAPYSAESNRTRVRRGDVLVSITADIGSIGIARTAHEGAYVSQHIALITPHDCEPEWLAFSLRGSTAQAWLDSGRYGGTKTQLALGDVAETPIWLPSAKEQKRRVGILGRELEHGRRTSSAIQHQIEILKERRQALITAVVTGELEIPARVVTPPAEVPR
jgi:type I restriction enzyme, S subunit